MKVENADFIELMPGFERTGGRSVGSPRPTIRHVSCLLCAAFLWVERHDGRMRLYISSDMEGVAGVSSWEQVDARNYTPNTLSTGGNTRKRLQRAVDGARAAGAGEVLVNDSHGPMRNLLFDELPGDFA